MNGRPTAARSTSCTSKPPWARARSRIHSPMGRPTRPGRVLATMMWSLGRSASAVGRVLDRQVASDGVGRLAGLRDLGAAEGDRGVLLRVEEVSRAQVAVALRITRVEGRHGQGRLDGRLRNVRLVHICLDVEVLKAPP